MYIFVFFVLQGDGAPKVEEFEEPFTSPRKPPPVVYTPQLDLMWLVLLSLAAGTRLLNLSTPNHVV